MVGGGAGVGLTGSTCRTDNGAYYYHNKGAGHANFQEALLDVQAALKKANIPVHYYQWDDWWFVQAGGDTGGLSKSCMLPGLSGALTPMQLHGSHPPTYSPVG